MTETPPPPPITNDEEHAAALAELTAFLDAQPEPAADSETGRRVVALAEAIQAYEKIRWPI